MGSYRKFSDQQLVALLKESNTNACTTLYNRYQGLLYVYACKIVKDDDIAEDIVQEIFLYLWDKRQTINFKSSVSGYLYSAIRYKFLDMVDSQKIRSDYVESFKLFLEVGHFSTDDYIREREFSVIIEREIANLPGKMRDVFLLSRRDQLKNSEISVLLDISEKTVKNQISAALKILRLKLGFYYLLSFFLHLILRSL